MGQRLKLDGAVLDDASSQLLVVAGELRDADAVATGLASSVGDEGLADAVREFVNCWDDRRADLADQVDGVQKSVAGLVEAFDSVDGDLARGVEVEQ